VAREAIRSVEVSLAPIWPTATLCSCLAVMRNGLTAPQNQGRRGCPVTRIETISGDRVAPEQVGYVEAISEEQRRKYLLQPGDILFSHINSEAQLGRSVRYSGLPTPLLHGMNLLLLRTNGMIDSSFLHYVLVYYRMQGVFVALASRSVNQSSINQGKLGALRVPLPPLAEQRAIAAVLDRVQHAIAATERVIAATRELKRSLMRHLFTYGPVPIQEAERVPLKETEIGLVPETWEIARLGHIAMVRGGKRVPKGHAFSDEQTPFPYVRVVDLCDGCVDLTRLKYLTREDRKAIDRYTISKDDVYISIAGSIGLVGLVPPELDGANLTENAAKLTALPNVAVDKGYLARFLASDVGQREVLKRTTKTSQPKLALALIREIAVALPPLSAQRRVAGALGVVDQKLQAEKRVHVSLSRLFDALLRDLMSGAVRVIGDQ